MKKETRTYTKDVYVASDGKEFDSEWDCGIHEEELEMDRREHLADHLLFKGEMPEPWPISFMVRAKDYYARWYSIKNEDDFKVFCKAFYSYCGWLKNPDGIIKDFTFPDYLCLVDFPHGPEDPKVISFNDVIKRTEKFTQKLNTDKEQQKHE